MEDRYLSKAKRIDNGEWIVGYLYRLSENNPPFIMLRKYGESYEVDEHTICQCTGSKDKNGKLIYENDVVDFLGHRGIVKFECGSFGIAYEKHIDWEEIQANIMRVIGCENILYACENDNYISLWEIYWNFNDEDDSVNTVEVIGNIFDNPELVESEEK